MKKNEKKYTNVQNLNDVAKNAKKDLQSVSRMYFINQLEKLRKKNEFVNNTNIAELGKIAQRFTKDVRNIDHKNAFTLYIFPVDRFGNSCYICTSKRVPAHKYDVIGYSDKGVWQYLKPIDNLKTLPQFVDAIKSILRPYCKDLDALEKANESYTKLFNKYVENLIKNGCNKEEAELIAQRKIDAEKIA